MHLQLQLKSPDPSTRPNLCDNLLLYHLTTTPALHCCMAITIPQPDLSAPSGEQRNFVRTFFPNSVNLYATQVGALYSALKERRIPLTKSLEQTREWLRAPGGTAQIEAGIRTHNPWYEPLSSLSTSSPSPVLLSLPKLSSKLQPAQVESGKQKKETTTTGLNDRNGF